MGFKSLITLSCVKLKSITFVLLFGIAAFGLAPSPAGAAVVYSYSGNNFTSFIDGTAPAGSYDTTMSVSGSFTLLSPLLSNTYSDISPLVLSFSFTDGRRTVDSSNVTAGITTEFLTSEFFRFDMATDATGAPVSWNIVLPKDWAPLINSLDESWSIETFAIQGVGSVDTGTIRTILTGDSFGVDTFTRDEATICCGPELIGSWIVTPEVVPIPAAAWLFGSGLIGLIGIARRKKS